VPADGVYAGRLVRAGGDRLPAAVSVGTNPTFDGRERTVEAYVLDADLDLYGEHVAVEFVQRLRGMERFADADALVAQMQQDVEQTRRILLPGGEPAPR
jgi:riboflavin kinase/FMN adenylyltransferase